MKLLVPVFSALLLSACGNTDTNNETTPNTPSSASPKAIGYAIVRTYPHDTSSFTQGLQLYAGNLYEGTGEKGHSHLMKVDLNTGKIQQQISLDNKYFGGRHHHPAGHGLSTYLAGKSSVCLHLKRF